MALFPFALTYAALFQEEDKPNEEKRKKVVDELMEHMEEWDLDLPDWMERFKEPLLGLIVDVTVKVAKDRGFFADSSES